MAHSSTPARAALPHGPDMPDTPLGWQAIMAAVLTALALLRCLVPIFPEIYWDVDPRSQMHQVIIAIGPVGAAWLDVIGVLVATAAMVMYRRAGHRLMGTPTLLALFGAGVALYQLTRHAPGAITLGAWISGMAMAVAMVHLAGHPQARRCVTAALAGVIVAWLLKAMGFIFWEHANTVENYLANEAQFLAARGWAEGSPQHLLFRRRLMYPDVTGAVGLSNIFGSLVAAMTMMSLGLAAMLVKQRRWRQSAGLLVLAIMAATVLYFTHSRGAMVAMALVMGLLALVVMGWKWRLARYLILPAVMVALLLPVGLVLVRASMGPPDSEAGERSLLFRAHYWEASVRMLAQGSWEDRLIGVGVGPYKDAYIAHKNPLNPEEVTSAHNMAVDWIAMLGLGGVAWTALTVLWLWKAGRGLAARDDARVEAEAAPLAPHWPWPYDRDVKFALAVGVAMLGLQFYVQKEVMLDPVQLVLVQLVLWCASLASFTAVAATLMHPRWVSPTGARLALALGAAGLMIHGQIEMIFFNLQAMPLAMLILAAAAAPSWREDEAPVQLSVPTEKRDGPHPFFQWSMPAGWLVVALVMGVVYLYPTSRQQTALGQAATALRENRPTQTLHWLDEAIRRLPRDPRSYDSKATLLVEIAMYHHTAGQPAQAITALNQVLTTLDAAAQAGLVDLNLLRRRAQVLELALQWTGDQQRLPGVIAAWQAVLDRAPDALTDTLRLADLLWAYDRHDEARAWYQRVLKLDEQSYLDHARQLPEAQRQRVQARTAGLAD